MNYLVNNFDNKIISKLKSGGVGVLPSDTIYGLSCQALDKSAVERIYELKGRQTNKPVIILISDLKMLDLLSISKSLGEPIKKYWPGPLTVVFDAPAAPAWLQRGSKTLAVRWPNKPELVKLINQVGPLVSTSANPEAEPPAETINEAKTYFGNHVDFYIDQGELKNEPSTIVKIENGKLQTLRLGTLKI